MTSLLRKAWSPTTYLLLLILQMLQYCCHADASSIDVAPRTQHANLTDLATFYCRATGANTRWSIGSDNYDTYNHTEMGYTFSEIIVDEKQGVVRVHDLYLEISATVENNSTQVRCVAFDALTSLSDIVFLIVQGGPAAPVPRLIVISPTLLMLEWDPSFTWPYTTIQHYSLSVNNSLEDWNQTLLTATSVEIRSTSGQLRECIAYTFSVSANNGLAQGEQGNVTGGFPIVDPHLPVDPIQYTLHYSSDFTPFLQLRVTLPEVCSYQTVTYLVTVTSADSRVVFHAESTVRYNDGEMLQFMLSGSELDNSVTSVHVTVTFVLDDIPSQQSPLTAQMAIVIEEGMDTEQVVLIAAVSGAALLIAIVFIVVVTFVCAYKKKRLYRTGSPKNSPMVTNPIYEGQSVYETIDPQFRAITFTSSNSIPGPPTPTSARPLIESPYAHSLVDPAYATAQPNLSPFPSGPAVMEEGYTVMTSAGGLGKTISDCGESDLDQKIPDNARYAPEPSMVANES